MDLLSMMARAQTLSARRILGLPSLEQRLRRVSLQRTVTPAKISSLVAAISARASRAG